MGTILKAVFGALLAGTFVVQTSCSRTLVGHSLQTGGALDQPSHIESGFEFTLAAPYEDVVPLFGADKERCWGGAAWNPEFIYPTPARDVTGAVFTVTHQHSRSTWVNTVFDLNAGRIQYVYFVPDALTTVIDIRVSRQGPSETKVRINYQRTALRTEINSHVQELAKQDEHSGQHWAKALSSCLK